MLARAAVRAGAAVLVAGVVTLAWAGPDPAEEGRKPRLQWLAYGEALERAGKEDKHVLVDFYTSWCGWCKKMDRETYTDTTVVDLLKQHFVISKINAESSRKFLVGDKQLSGRDLAVQFGVQQFPMTSFLKPDGTKLANLPGYHPAERFVKILEYVRERRYLKDEMSDPSPGKSGDDKSGDESKEKP